MNIPVSRHIEGEWWVATKFEDLSVELILEIFDLLRTEAEVLYKAFYNLNFRLNRILEQTHIHITNSTKLFILQIIHPEQIKSLLYVASHMREIPVLFKYLSPEIIVSLNLNMADKNDHIDCLLSILVNFRNLNAFRIWATQMNHEQEKKLYSIISELPCLKVK